MKSTFKVQVNAGLFKVGQHVIEIPEINFETETECSTNEFVHSTKAFMDIVRAYEEEDRKRRREEENTEKKITKEPSDKAEPRPLKYTSKTNSIQPLNSHHCGKCTETENNDNHCTTSENPNKKTAKEPPYEITIISPSQRIQTRRHIFASAYSFVIDNFMEAALKEELCEAKIQVNKDGESRIVFEGTNNEMVKRIKEEKIY